MSDQTSIRILRALFYLMICFAEFQVPTEPFKLWLPVLGEDRYTYFKHLFLFGELFAFLKYSFMFCCIMCAFSIANRMMSVATFLIGSGYLLSLYSLRHGMMHHHLIWHVLLVFSLFENFESFSVKQFVLVVRILFVSVFFTAGITKLRNIGVDWFDLAVLRDFLLVKRALYFEHIGKNTFDYNLLALQNLDLIKYAFYAVLPLELLAPISFFGRIPRYTVTIALIGLQIFAAKAMYAVFTEYIAVYPFMLLPIEYDSKSDLFIKSLKKES